MDSYIVNPNLIRDLSVSWITRFPMTEPPSPEQWLKWRKKYGLHQIKTLMASLAISQDRLPGAFRSSTGLQSFFARMLEAAKMQRKSRCHSLSAVAGIQELVKNWTLCYPVVPPHRDELFRWLKRYPVDHILRVFETVQYDSKLGPAHFYRCVSSALRSTHAAGPVGQENNHGTSTNPAKDLE